MAMVGADTAVAELALLLAVLLADAAFRDAADVPDLEVDRLVPPFLLVAVTVVVVAPATVLGGWACIPPVPGRLLLLPPPPALLPG